MRSLRERLASGDIIVADGAMGSQLIERGLEGGACPESLNLSKPEILEEIAREYLEAGAEIIQTNTFGGSPMNLANYDLREQTEAVNKAAVAAVKRAVDGKALISGSVGPSGKMLEPFGEATVDKLLAGFRRQIGYLLEGGVDLLCIETMVDVNEAIAAVRAARKLSATIPIMATMTFNASPRGFNTLMGNDIHACVEVLEAEGADIIGSNCTNGVETMVQLATEMRGATKLPILIQSNAGQPFMDGSDIIYPEQPELFEATVPLLIKAGVQIIGGCCGTTPDHIKGVRTAVDNYSA